MITKMYTCPRGHASQAGDYCDECGTPIGGTAHPAVASPTPAGSTPAETTSTCPQCGAIGGGRFCEVCGHDFLLARIAPGTAPAAAPPDPATAFPAAPLPATAFPAAVPDEPTTFDTAGFRAPSSGPPEPVPVRYSPAGRGPGVAVAGYDPTVPGTVVADGADPAVVRAWRLVAVADPAYHAMMQDQAEPDAIPIPFPAFCPERRFALAGGQALIGRRSRSRGIEPEVDLSGPPADPAVSHAHALLIAQPTGGWSVVDLDSANGTFVNDDPDPIVANKPIALIDGDRIHVGAWTTLTLRPA